MGIDCRCDCAPIDFLDDLLRQIAVGCDKYGLDMRSYAEYIQDIAEQHSPVELQTAAINLILQSNLERISKLDPYELLSYAAWLAGMKRLKEALRIEP